MRTWLFFPSSPKLASPNNLQCALQLSRNQAGHRLLLLFHQTIEIEFLHHNLYASFPLPCLSCIFLLLLPRSACSIGKSGEKGKDSLNQLKDKSSRKLTSWTWEIQAHLSPLPILSSLLMGHWEKLGPWLFSKFIFTNLYLWFQVRKKKYFEQSMQCLVTSIC